MRGNSFEPGTTRETVESGWFRVQKPAVLWTWASVGVPWPSSSRLVPPSSQHGPRESHVPPQTIDRKGKRDHEQHIMQDVVVPKPSDQQRSKASEHKGEAMSTSMLMKWQIHLLFDRSATEYELEALVQVREK